MTINFPNNPGYGAGETSSYTYSSDGIVQSWYWGETGDNPVEAWIPDYSGTIGGGGGGVGSQGNQGFQGFQGPAGSGEGAGSQGFQGFQGPAGSGEGGSPQGPEGSVQFADSGSLSGISEVGIFSNLNLNPEKGLSANFLSYTESLSADTQIKNQSNETKTLDFGKYNIQVIENIALPENGTFTVNGITPIVGASMTVILGHTGASGSKIVIPDMGIYWSDGPANGGSGSTAYIFPTLTKKKFDVLYFFSDGSNVFGNHMSNYIQKR